MKIFIFLKIVIFLLIIVFPRTGIAQSSNQLQTEYSNYESVSNSDMVNLSTGDFVYNLPLIEVPGPNGGFTAPITYNAGILTEQEASWIGLGWNVNCGAVIRSVSGYPDDFNGKDISNFSYQDLGNGSIKNFLLYTKQYDSEQGTGGVISLLGFVEMGWGTMAKSDVIGFGIEKGGKVKFDAVQFASIVLTVVSQGTGYWAELANNMNNLITAYNAAKTFAQIQSTNNKTAMYGNITTKGNWTFLKGSLFGYNYRSYYDVHSYVKAYGSMYLGNVGYSGGHYFNGWKLKKTDGTPATYSTGGINCYPLCYDEETTNGSTLISSSASDVQMPINQQYFELEDASSINYDNFYAQGEGVSGSIKPYRLDIGSLAPACTKRYTHWRMVVSPFRFNMDSEDTTNALSYKVQFMYPGQPANYYTYQYNNPNTGTHPEGIQLGSQNWTIQDVKLLNENDKMQTRSGINRKRLIQDKYVLWYSNREIKDVVFKRPTCYMYDGIFMDYHNTSQRAAFRTAHDPDQIGGFAITRPDGLTYHYALPVYNKSEEFHVSNWSNNKQIDNYNNNEYATAWLLTGITGPDFIDRGEIGIIDDDDLGYWVKFNYGKFSSQFKWRNPYAGFAQDPENTGDISFESGSRETYYLNSVETKSHIALFIKSLRKDGKGCFSMNGTTIYKQSISSSLKLDDILVLKKDNFNNFISNRNFVTSSTAFDSELQNSDTYSNVLDAHDFQTGDLAALYNLQDRRIHFNYATSANELCKKTINSFEINDIKTNSNPYSNVEFFNGLVNGEHVNGGLADLGGKLTLSGIDLYTRNNSKEMPGYAFEYNDNPDYSIYKSDGWGMYSPFPTSMANPNYSHIATFYGKEWSLKKIITPLGSEVEVEYERDSYLKINGLGIGTSWTRIGTSDWFKLMEGKNSVDYNGILKNTNFEAMCYISNGSGFSTTVQIVETNLTSSGELQVKFSFASTNTFQTVYLNSSLSSFNYSNVISCYGGNIRVKSIKMKDEKGNEYKNSYIFSDANGLSYGSCTMEPGGSKHPGSSIYTDQDYKKKTLLYDYPMTPVMYSKVSVISNSTPENTPSLGSTITTFCFEEPNINMLSHSNTYNGGITNLYYDEYHYTHFYEKNSLEVSTSKIGRLLEIGTYNSFNQLLNNQKYYYSDGTEYNLMGQFTEASILAENIYENSNIHKIRYVRTEKKYFPNILSKIVTTDQNANQETISNDVFDIYTGIITQSTHILPNGKIYCDNNGIVNNAIAGKMLKTSTYLAYYFYPDMGSKVVDPKYHNLLAQSAATYYSFVESGEWKAYDAKIQTWSNTMKERNFNESTGKYQTVTSPYDIWRPYKSWIWKGELNSDGTYKSSDPYWDFLSTNIYEFTYGDAYNINLGWVVNKEITQYNSNSVPLEVKDINNRFVATKRDINDQFVIASVAGANYNSFAYSGFERKKENVYGNGYIIPDYEGEVMGGYSGNELVTSVGSDKPHTGKYCIKVEGGNYGPAFCTKYDVNGNGLQRGKTYRVSVWIHKDSPNTSYLVADLIGSVTGDNHFRRYVAKSITESTIEINHWKLVNLDIEVPNDYVSSGNPDFTENQLAVYFYNPGVGNTPSYFDDFRIHPVDCQMVSYVIDPDIWKTSAMLDNENMATIYEYDDSRRIVRIKKETKNGINTVKEYEYHYALETP